VASPYCFTPWDRRLGGPPAAGLNNMEKLKFLTLLGNRKVAGSRTDEVKFSIYLILPAALDPVVYSASKKNEYGKY
jgi:hypothetical protein